MRNQSVTSASLISLLQKLFNSTTILSPVHKVANPSAGLLVSIVGTPSSPKESYREVT
jgi:hypothetical protein